MKRTALNFSLSGAPSMSGKVCLGIKYRVLLHFAAVILVLFPATGFFAYQNGREAVETQIEQQTLSFASQTLEKVNNHLALAAHAVKLTNNLASSDVLRVRNPEDILRYFDEMKRTYPQFQSFYFGDEDGRFLMVPPQNPEAALIYDPRVRPWYVRAMESDSCCWTGVYLFSSSRRPGITAASRVLSPSGEPIGVVGVDIDLTSLSLFLKESILTPGAMSFILDSTGKYVAHPDMDMIGKEASDPIIRERVLACIDSRSVKTGVIELGGGKYFAAHAPHLDKKWVITVLVPYSDFMGSIENIRRSFTMTFAMAIILGALLSIYVSSHIYSPIVKLTALIKGLRTGDAKGRVETTAEDEIGELACEFNALSDDLSEKNFQLTSLHDLGKVVGDIFDLPSLLRNIVSNAARSMRSSRCSVALWNDREARFMIRTAVGFGGAADVVENIDTRGGADVLFRIRDLNEPLLVRDITTDPRFTGVPDMAARVREGMRDVSFVAAPLVAREKFLGIISVSGKEGSESFNEDDLRLLVILASQIVIAIDNANLYKENLLKARLDKELEIAHNLQQRLLPTAPPKIKGVSIASNYIPATEVSGDYYDFLGPDSDGLHFAVGDVSGKGIPASMLMIMVRSLLRYEIGRGDLSMASIMQKINNLLTRDIDPSMFITMVHGRLDLKTWELSYVNAGHCYPLIVHEDGSSEYLTSTGLLLGVFEEAAYGEKKIRLRKGDVLFVYSDGIEDVQNPADEKLGLEAVASTVIKNRHLGAPTINQELINLVEEYRNGALQFDDITYIIIKVQ